MKSLFFIFAISLVLFTSCGKNSADYKALKAQNDSLLNAKQALQTEVDGYFMTMNQIEQNIEKIKNAEDAISIQPKGQELTVDQQTKINDDMAYLSQLLQANKDELAQLKLKLKNSGFKSTQLQRTISRLTKSLDEQTAQVLALQTQLSERDSVISTLGTRVSDLDKNVEVLSTDVKSKETKIKEQDDAIHTAWYVFGTKKELKEQNITSSEGLFSSKKVLQKDFNKNYFVRIDARNTKSIPLFSKRAKILTVHPKSSYTLEKESENFVLLITNPSDFWSISKYLVIEVD